MHQSYLSGDSQVPMIMVSPMPLITCCTLWAVRVPAFYVWRQNNENNVKNFDLIMKKIFTIAVQKFVKLKGYLHYTAKISNFHDFLVAARLSTCTAKWWLKIVTKYWFDLSLKIAFIKYIKVIHPSSRVSKPVFNRCCVISTHFITLFCAVPQAQVHVLHRLGHSRVLLVTSEHVIATQLGHRPAQLNQFTEIQEEKKTKGTTGAS